LVGGLAGRAIGWQPWFALGSGKELCPVVREILGTHDVEIAGLQHVREVHEDADFQRAPIDGNLRAPPGHKNPPAARRETEVDVALHVGTARVAMSAHHGPGAQQAAILCRRPDVE
jgi:hypothetical protein